MKIKRWIRERVKKLFRLYDLSDLTVGAHCGLCGINMPEEIVCKGKEWAICDKCAGIPVNKFEGFGF